MLLILKVNDKGSGEKKGKEKSCRLCEEALGIKLKEKIKKCAYFIMPIMGVIKILVVYGSHTEGRKPS